MQRRRLDMKNHRIWKDKEIKPEVKQIYSYIYAKGFDQIITHINVGELQHRLSITNVGLRNNLNILENNKYLIYREYDTGMYEIHIC